ncbi:hypothetical protein ACSX1A_10625 [Pontibacter sp. MBLB2868]
MVWQRIRGLRPDGASKALKSDKVGAESLVRVNGYDHEIKKGIWKS